MTIACETLGRQEGQHGSIAEISFRGNVEQGSSGNDQTLAMTEYVRGVVAEEDPDALLFDMTRLKYSWGDGIGGIFIVMLSRQERDAPARPAAVFAGRETAKAVASLLEFSGLGRLSEIGVFETRSEAVSFVETCLAQQQ